MCAFDGREVSCQTQGQGDCGGGSGKQREGGISKEAQLSRSLKVYAGYVQCAPCRVQRHPAVTWVLCGRHHASTHRGDTISVYTLGTHTHTHTHTKHAYTFVVTKPPY